MAAVRNQLEHRYLKLHLFGPPEPPGPGESRIAGEELAYSLDRRDFEQRTLRLLEMARSALINLSLAVHVEEERRQGEDAVPQLTILVPSGVWDDRWKF
jgi:hypothetical protein